MSNHEDVRRLGRDGEHSREPLQRFQRYSRYSRRHGDARSCARCYAGARKHDINVLDVAAAVLGDSDASGAMPAIARVAGMPQTGASCHVGRESGRSTEPPWGYRPEAFRASAGTASEQANSHPTYSQHTVNIQSTYS